jgi:hyperosmotically inducible protein
MNIRWIALCGILLASILHANTPLKEIKKDLSDSVISTKITAKFTENLMLNPLKIAVSTENGVVSLRGHVKSKKAFVEALRIAVNTKGVHQVDTDALHIKKVNTAFTDAFITAKVETAVLKAKVLDNEAIPLAGINAHTKNGIVTLSGEVENTAIISDILKRVHKVRGVKKIISHLRIEKSKP